MCHTDALIPSIGGTGTHNSRLGSIYPGMHSHHATRIPSSTLFNHGRQCAVTVAMYILLLASFGSLQAVDANSSYRIQVFEPSLPANFPMHDGFISKLSGGPVDWTGLFVQPATAVYQYETGSVALTVNGTSVKVVVAADPPWRWIMTLTGSIDSQGNMAGDWTDNFGSSGTWTMDLELPESDLTRGTARRADGSTDAVGSSTQGVTQVLTYTITNSGKGILTTSETKVIAGSNCSAVLTTAPGATIAPSKTSNLVLSITPTSMGAWTATASIVTNDADENPYNWTISGTAAASTSTTPAEPQSAATQPDLPATATLGDPAGSSSNCGVGSLAGLLLTLLAGIGLGYVSGTIWPHARTYPRVTRL